MALLLPRIRSQGLKAHRQIRRQGNDGRRACQAVTMFWRVVYAAAIGAPPPSALNRATLSLQCSQSSCRWRRPVGNEEAAFCKVICSHATHLHLVPVSTTVSVRHRVHANKPAQPQGEPKLQLLASGLADCRARKETASGRPMLKDYQRCNTRRLPKAGLMLGQGGPTSNQPRADVQCRRVTINNESRVPATPVLDREAGRRRQ